MKQMVRLAAFLLLGVALGVGLVGVGLALFGDMPFPVFLSRLAAVGIWDLAAVFFSSVAAFVLALLLQVLLHELGHLFFGLASGYRFVSFRIFSLTVARDGGRLRLRRFAVAGTGGQCLLSPPDIPIEKIPVVLYNLGGVIFNAVSVAIAAALLMTLHDIAAIADIFLVQTVVMGLLLVACNGIPMRLGGMSNDGEDLRQMLSNPAAKRALMAVLRVNAEVQQGVRPKDIPVSLLEQPQPVDYGNALQVNLEIMRYGQMQDMGRWEEARLGLEQMLLHEKELLEIFRREISAELLFLSLAAGLTERAGELSTKRLLEYVRAYSGVMSSKTRVLFATTLVGDGDEAAALRILDALKRKKEGYLMRGEVESDIWQMERLLERYRAGAAGS